REQFARARLGLVKLHPWLIDPSVEWRNHFTDQNHHIGTARIGDSPYTAVLDANCRLHSVDNLHVASCAVLPTGGHSNPTLTMLALVIRLADHLRATCPFEIHTQSQLTTRKRKNANEGSIMTNVA